MKPIFYTYLISLLLFTISSHAQTWDWTAYAGSTGQDSKPLMRFDNKGSIFVSGNYGGDFSLGGQDLIFNSWSAHFIAKYQLDGQLIWIKSYDNHKSKAKTIATDNDGNLYVSGVWSGSSIDIDGTILSTDDTHGNTYLAKYDPNGTLIWARNDFGGIIIEQIAVDKSNKVCFAGSYYFPTGFFFGGNTYDYDNTLASNYGDGVTGKFDSDGNALWVHTFNGPDRDDVTAIGTDDENNLYVTGRFKSDVLSIDYSSSVINKVDAASDGFDLFIIKYNDQGNQEWLKHEGASATVAESPPLMTVDDQGIVTVISDFRLDNLLIDGTKTITGKDWCTTTLVIQFDASGQLKLATSAFGSNRIIGTDIVSYKDKLYLTGCFGEEFSSTATTLTSNGSFDAYLAEIDQQGNWNWALSFGGDFIDRPQSLTFDDAGNLYLSLATNSTSIDINNTTYTGLGQYDYLFGKLDLGFTSGLNPLMKDQISISAFPNPGTNLITFDLGKEESTGFLDVFNVAGNFIDRILFTNKNKLKIDLSAYSQGMYLIKVNTDRGVGVAKVFKK